MGKSWCAEKAGGACADTSDGADSCTATCGMVWPGTGGVRKKRQRSASMVRSVAPLYTRSSMALSISSLSSSFVIITAMAAALRAAAVVSVGERGGERRAQRRRREGAAGTGAGFSRGDAGE